LKKEELEEAFLQNSNTEHRISWKTACWAERDMCSSRRMGKSTCSTTWSQSSRFAGITHERSIQWN